jgi:mRNA interferase YafQ
MRIKWSSAFKRDYKKVKRGGRHDIDSMLPAIVAMLLSFYPLDISYRDHPLHGKWEGYRECHLRPDLLLIYRKSGEVLLLARLGSHSELF